MRDGETKAFGMIGDPQFSQDIVSNELRRANKSLLKFSDHTRDGICRYLGFDTAMLLSFADLDEFGWINPDDLPEKPLTCGIAYV